MYIIIVGGGKVGEFLAKTLSERKHDIVIVEKDEEISSKVAELLEKVTVVCGDGCDPLRLEDAGAARAHVVAAVTGDDEDNLIICQLAKEKFKVPRTIARANNPKNEETFHKLGMDAVSSTTIISKLIEEEATVGDLITLLALKKGNLAIVEATLEADSKAVGHPLKELKLPKDSVIASIIRENKVIFPKGNSVFRANDSIIALTTPDKEKDLKKILI